MTGARSSSSSGFKPPSPPEGTLARRLVVALLLASIAGAMACATAAGTVLVSAASSLKEAVRDVADRFEAAHPGIEIVVNAAASGVLLRQIEEDAPVDLFLSASPDEIRRLECFGRIEAGTARPFASNRLVVIVPAGGSPPSTLAGLSDPRFHRIAIGNPRTVPAGRYAEQALRWAGILDAVAPRLVPGESARQALEYVARGEVEAGLVYATDVRALDGKVARGPAAPDGSHDPIVCLAAPLRDAPHRKEAEALTAFLLSEEGRGILARRGFLPPPAP
jgi:molybdate transport system substrate-binding protein